MTYKIVTLIMSQSVWNYLFVFIFKLIYLFMFVLCCLDMVILYVAYIFYIF